MLEIFLSSILYFFVMQASNHYKKTSIVLFSLWVVFMFFMLFMPGDLLAQRRSSLFNIPHSDKIIHCAVFGGFTLFLQFMLFFNTSIKLRKIYLISIGVCLLFGIITEIIQALTFEWCGRRFELKDYVSDVIGGVLALVFFKIIEKKVNKRLQNEK